MKTILVPVDFTSTTENAVRVAAEWAKQYNYGQIILLKTSEEFEFDYLHIAEGNSFVNSESINNLLERTESLLYKLSQIIVERLPDINILTETSSWNITRSVNQILKDYPSIELIILGSDVQAESGDSIVSENIISLARTSPVKTLIVPNRYRYSKIKDVLIPCDINSITKVDRLFHYRSVIQQQDYQLKFLNILTKENTNITDEKKNELENYIHQNLIDIPSSISYSYDKNIINGIINCAKSNDTDLIIALPGRHSFLYYLTSNSISEGIYQNINLPVMVLK
jgi:nucleotide-binding universal stress UspA family protein